ncbi:vancomycin resistance histidine kinase VanS [Cytobacillus purgationiresistens]
MILQIIIILIIAVAIGLFISNVLIDGILQAPFADWFIRLLQNLFEIDYYAARATYMNLFQGNKPIWLATGMIVLLLIIFYIALTRFTRYFKEINKSIHMLAEEDEKEIILPPELDFMEKNLNTVKGNLAKRARDAQEAEQRKNDLVVYLAHDIKTPLTSVIGYLSLLDEANDMPAQQREKYVKITLNKANRLEELINEFFDITRFNLQTIVLDKSPINISFMLMQMADEFYPLLASKGSQAVVNAGENVTVDADADKLARVFNNILKNAMMYSDDHSTIDIDVRTEEVNAIIEFSNKGKTIPEHKLQSIFEKFYRLDESRSSHSGGAGLGLAIAKEIVLAHDGDITAKSEAGITVFTVTLPILRES